MAETGRKPASRVNLLQKWVNERARERNIAVMRLQRWISFMVFAAALDRVRDERDEPLFVAKGGVVMELRLGLEARATQDFDATFRASVETMLDRLDEALAEPYGHFKLSRDEPEYENEDGFTKLRIKLAYRGKSWQSIVLELMPADGTWAKEIDEVPAIDIREFGIEGPDKIPCIPLRYQIAQKIHACTETLNNGEPNDRSRDLIDLLLLRGLLPDGHLPDVRKACLETFRIRKKHAWPPTLSVPLHWIEQYREEAGAVDFGILDVDEAAERVRELIAEIDGAKPPRLVANE
jgi:hypothetical protein